MKTITVIFMLIIVFLTNSFITYAQVDEGLTGQLKSYVSFLANDEMQGRFPGTPENTKAANYISGKFKEYGLEPIAGDFFMPFKFIDTLDLGENNDVAFMVLIRKPGVPVEMLRSRTKHWKTGKDWLPMRFSKNGNAEGEVVFCGYGITSKETGYDDYQGIDVKDKIVLVLADSSEGMPLDDFWTPESDLSSKADNAAKHGAAAIVFIKVLHDSANVFYGFDVDRKYKSDIVAINANRTMISKLFPKKMPLLKIERGINETKKPNSFVLPDITMAISTEVNEVEKEINNIVGIVKGTDNNLKDEYIVVGANFDGFGSYWYKPKWTPRVWTVLNSADANASGTAAMLELAKRITEAPLKRSVIFAGFNAGVTGSEGAKHFTEKPPVPIEKIALMLNLNTVGRMRDDRLYIIGSGTGSNFFHILNMAKGQDSSINIIQGQKSYCRADHLPFYKSDIPVLMITTGLHTDIGKSTDDSDKINYDGIVRTIDFAENTLNEIGNSPSKPLFNPDPLLADYKKVKKGYRCWFGIVPDYEINAGGLLIADVFRHSPANKANIKSGDIISKFEGKDIKSYHDLKSALRLTKPGDSVQLLIIRGGQEKTVKVKMEKRSYYLGI
ncbi:M28 family peptidase [Bacteroidota bacterium]